MSQHEKIWSTYSEWLFGIEPLDSIKVSIGRYLELRPDFKERLVEILVEREDYGCAVKSMQEIIDDD